jgi:hypothetical protein
MLEDPPNDAIKAARKAAKPINDLVEPIDAARDRLDGLVADAHPDAGTRSPRGLQQKIAQAAGLSDDWVRQLRGLVRAKREKDGAPVRETSMAEALEQLPEAAREYQRLLRKRSRLIAEFMPPPSPPGERVSGWDRELLQAFSAELGLSVSALRRIQSDWEAERRGEQPRMRGRRLHPRAR